MGKLIDGKWTDENLEIDSKGRFVRKPSSFRSMVTADGSSGFAASPGRYHLYVAHACGWSHRTVLFRQLIGLESVVSISFVQPHMGEHGWTFAEGGATRPRGAASSTRSIPPPIPTTRGA